MNGEVNKIPIYNAVELIPFKNEESPLFSNITAINGRSMP